MQQLGKCDHLIFLFEVVNYILLMLIFLEIRKSLLNFLQHLH